MPKVYDGIVRTSLGGGVANIGALVSMAMNLRMTPSDTDAGTLRGMVLKGETTPVLGIPPNRTWTNG